MGFVSNLFNRLGLGGTIGCLGCMCIGRWWMGLGLGLLILILDCSLSDNMS